MGLSSSRGWSGSRLARREHRNRVIGVLVLVGIVVLALGCSDWVMLDAERRILYKVKRGDNLYAIGFLYGLDYRQIAQENGIRPPYTIFVGQTIAIIPPDYMQIVPQEPEPIPTAPPVAAEPVIESAIAPTPVHGSAADTPSDYWAEQSSETPAVIPTQVQMTTTIIKTPIPATPIPPPLPPVVKPNTPSITVLPATTDKNSTQRPLSSAATADAEGISAATEPMSGNYSPTAIVPANLTRLLEGVNWQWPYSGVVKQNFSPNLQQNGIDIGGQEGEPVVAAADGTVVYSGNGLLGYGNLLIVRHNDSYLSAYAYNRKLLVGKGTSLKRGQVIAEMGSTRPLGAALHFEVRKNGKPVDPLRYLPKL